MATVSQTHRAFFGLGQLVRSNDPPIVVSYDIVVIARRVDGFMQDGQDEQQWEWDKAVGFVTLMDDAEIVRIDPGQEYTLVLANGRVCRPTLLHGYNKLPARFSFECLPTELTDGDRPG